MGSRKDPLSLRAVVSGASRSSRCRCRAPVSGIVLGSSGVGTVGGVSVCRGLRSNGVAGLRADGLRTGMPATGVVVSSVCEKMRLEDAFAASYFCWTRVGRFWGSVADIAG